MMRLVYYLQLQDRIDEAKIVFKHAELDLPQDGTGLVPFDYFRAYFDFSNAMNKNFKNAKEVS